MKKPIIFLKSITAIVVVFLLFIASCKKEILQGDAVTNNLGKGSKSSTSSTNISVNWDNWTNGDNYNVAMAIADFGDINNFTQVEQARTLISLSRLRVTLLKNEYGAAGGVITNSYVGESDGFELNYKVKFHSTFDFKTKGVIGWGFNIGDGAAGVDDGEGGTFRLMWDKDANGNFYLKPYIYYADQPGTSGHDFGVRYPATGSIVGSVWYEVKMVFKANTKLDRNGRAELYINGTQVLNTPIRWTYDDAKRKVNQLLFANYRSGAGSESNIDCNVWFDDFTMVSSTPTYSPTWVDNNVTVDSAYDQTSKTMYYVTIVKNLSSTQLKMAYADQSWGEVGDHFARRLDAAVVLNGSMGIPNLPGNQKQPVGKQVINDQIIQDIYTKNFTLGIKNNNELVDYDTPTTPQSMIADGSHYALTAFSPLIKNYQSVVDSAMMVRMTNYDDKNPRQVIGQLGNDDIIIFSCTGRDKGGEGMVVDDVLRLLQTYNTKYAFMLDGGGSVQTIVNGKIMTRLIDTAGTALRARPNFLYVPYPHNPNGD